MPSKSGSPKLLKLISDAASKIRNVMDKDKNPGWQSRLQAWAAGMKKLDALLLDPSFSYEKYEPFSLWAEKELNNLISTPAIPYFLTFFRLTSEHLRSTRIQLIIEDDTAADTIDFEKNVDKEDTSAGLTFRVGKVVEIIMDSVLGVGVSLRPTVTQNIGCAYLASIFTAHAKDIHTRAWITLLVSLLEDCLTDKFGNDVLQSDVSEILGIISGDEMIKEGKALMKDSAVLGFKKLGSLLHKSKATGTSIGLLRIVQALLSPISNLQIRTKELKEVLQNQKWSQGVLKEVFTKMGKEEKAYEPDQLMIIFNILAKDTSHERPRAYQAASLIVDDDDHLSSEKAKRYLKQDKIILYLDQWGLIFKGFDKDGEEEDTAFEHRNIMKLIVHNNFEINLTYMTKDNDDILVQFGVKLEQVDKFLKDTKGQPYLVSKMISPRLSSELSESSGQAQNKPDPEVLSTRPTESKGGSSENVKELAGKQAAVPSKSEKQTPAKRGRGRPKKTSLSENKISGTHETPASVTEHQVAGAATEGGQIPLPWETETSIGIYNESTPQSATEKTGKRQKRISPPPPSSPSSAEGSLQIFSPPVFSVSNYIASKPPKTLLHDVFHIPSRAPVKPAKPSNDSPLPLGIQAQYGSASLAVQQSTQTRGTGADAATQVESSLKNTEPLPQTITEEGLKSAELAPGRSIHKIPAVRTIGSGPEMSESTNNIVRKVFSEILEPNPADTSNNLLTSNDQVKASFLEQRKERSEGPSDTLAMDNHHESDSSVQGPIVSRRSVEAMFQQTRDNDEIEKPRKKARLSVLPSSSLAAGDVRPERPSLSSNQSHKDHVVGIRRESDEAPGKQIEKRPSRRRSSGANARARAISQAENAASKTVSDMHIHWNDVLNLMKEASEKKIKLPLQKTRVAQEQFGKLAKSILNDFQKESKTQMMEISKQHQATVAKFDQFISNEVDKILTDYNETRDAIVGLMKVDKKQWELNPSLF
ncbi:uncharacterized protein IL334_001704 [Kwoniella shivajii]|uniref:TOG domain-containing protein n=1 Tax=Kwoniella shivajii TaxID=564305 RepID=A0ABZ1CT10_9TREE|nr:hypothetical protein IL334_001704 [Kwoniella shivajii]